MKKSIRKYNTTGMELFDRYDLYEKVIPIQIGEVVWYAGDCWEYPEKIKVTEENQETVTMFWNALYFDKEEDAIRRNGEARADYEYWKSGAWR